jgi:NRPS condensation-like uncharacterized protein
LAQKQIPQKFRAVFTDKGGYVLAQIMDYQIQCVISFNGPIDETVLRRAFQLSLDAEPILGCKFVYHKRTPYWQRIENPVTDDTFRVRDTSEPDAAINEFIAEKFDPLVGPQIKLCLIRSGKDTLCIKANHLPTDGASVKEYAYLLADIYSNLLKDKEYTVEPNINGGRSYRQIGDKLGFIDRLKVIRRFFRDLESKKSHWQCIIASNEGSDFVMVSKSITQERFLSIKQYGMERGATINDMLVAAYFRALYKTLGPCDGIPLGILTTADHRKRYIPSGKTGATCNLSGFYFSNLAHELGKDYDDTLARVVKDINSRKDDFIGLGEIPFVALLFKSLPFALASIAFRGMLRAAIEKHGKLTAGITNLGIIDTTLLDFGAISIEEAFMVVPASIKPKNSLVVGVTTFKNKLNLVCSYYGREEDRRGLDELLENIVKELPL